ALRLPGRRTRDVEGRGDLRRQRLLEGVPGREVLPRPEGGADLRGHQQHAAPGDRQAAAREDVAHRSGRGGATVAPICRSRPRRSEMKRASAIFPSSIVNRSKPTHLTALPVAGIDSNSPPCVASTVYQMPTLLPSASILSIVTCRSGKAARCRPMLAFRP